VHNLTKWYPNSVSWNPRFREKANNWYGNLN